MGVPGVNLLWPSRIIIVTDGNPISLVCFIKFFFKNYSPGRFRSVGSSLSRNELKIYEGERDETEYEWQHPKED
jgi:hypothetical protein